MQRALSYALSPAPGVPLRFLLTAPWFGVLAGLLAVAFGPAMFESRWTAPVLAATHLLTIGYLALAMAGSLLQLIPVVTGIAVPLARLAGAITWPGLSVGALLLATAFLGGDAHFFLGAGAALALSFLVLLVAVIPVLLRPCPGAALAMVRGVRFAIPALALTVGFGLALVAYLSGGPTLPVLLLTDLHAGWGMAGWVGMMVVCVGFQVIPMFQSTGSYPGYAVRLLPVALALALLLWTALALLPGGLAPVAGVVTVTVLAGFALLSLAMLWRRKRRQADATTLYWYLALASLLACLPVAVLGADPLLGGVLFICGFAIPAVNGMLYKIVPFLLWYHLQMDPRARKETMPSIRTVLPERAAQRQFMLHAAALPLLLGAAVRPEWLARPAGALLIVASLHLATDLARAALLCRRIRKSF